MNTWRKYTVIYEINTWVWLSELSRTHRRPVTLTTVPDQEWDALAAHGSAWVHISITAAASTDRHEPRGEATHEKRVEKWRRACAGASAGRPAAFSPLDRAHYSFFTLRPSKWLRP